MPAPKNQISRREFLKQAGKGSLGLILIGAAGCKALSSNIHEKARYNKRLTKIIRETHTKPTNPTNKKIGVNLAGGGIMCARHIGVLAALENVYGIKPHKITGVSAGAANATGYAGGLEDKMEDIWIKEVTKNDFASARNALIGLIGRRIGHPAMGEKSYFDTPRLVKYLMNENSPYKLNKKELDNKRPELILSVVTVDREPESHYFSSKDNDFYEKLPSLLLANMAEPIGYGRTVNVMIEGEVRKAMDPFYVSPMITHGEADIQVCFPSRTVAELSYNGFRSGLTRRLRKLLSLQNARGNDVKKQLIRNVQYASKKNRERIESMENAICVEPLRRLSRTDNSLSNIQETILEGYLATVTNPDLHDAFNHEPDKYAIREVVRIYNNIS